jgi:hypothetical protein
VILEWVRIPPLLRGSVDVFVALGGIPEVALVSGMWESSLAPHCTFVLVKTILDWSLGLHGLEDGLWGLVLGFHTHMCE